VVIVDFLGYPGYKLRELGVKEETALV